MYDLGILGGMGSKATVQLFDIIVENTRATRDQEHLNIAILNNATIPDRTSKLLQNQKNLLLPYFIKAIQALEVLKVKDVIIPCNTSHLLFEELQAKTDLHMINMVNETLHYLSLSSKSSKTICVLGTLGTVKLRLFEHFNTYGLEICYPSEKICDKVQNIIYQIKDTANNNPDKLVDELVRIMEEVKSSSTKDLIFVLGCTELSLLNKSKLKKFNYVDPLEIVGLIAILRSERELQYDKLPYEYDAIERVAALQGGL